MNKLINHAVICVLFLVIAMTSVHAAFITFSDDTTAEVDQITFEEGVFTLRTGSDSATLSKNEIKNISFTGEAQQTAVLATDSADLLKMRERAIELLATYPDARSISIADEGNYQHRSDGTNLSRYRAVIFIAKEEALSNAHVSLGFDPNRERVKFIHARALNPDGELHSVDPDQIQVSKGSSGSQFFNQRQQLSLTIPEVKVGSVIDYCYEIEEFNPFDPNLFQGRFFFQDNNPNGESVVKVSVPRDKKLYHISMNCDGALKEPEIIDAVDSRIYIWKMRDVPPLIQEPYMPAFRDVTPMIYYSLHKDFTYIHNKLQPMFEKRFLLTDYVKETVNNIIEGSKDLHEKISKLYLFCQQEIRYISIKGNLASNQVGHAAEETLRNRYGDCTDKGMLLATMLKHIGVEAYPVGVRTNDAGKAIRSLGMFDDNHCITEVHLDGRIFYLDSTATDYRYPFFRSDNHATTVDNTMLKTLRNVPLPPPEDNAVHITRDIQLFADGSTRIEFESVLNGSAEASFRGSVRNTRPEEYVRQVRASISGLTADYDLEVATHSDPLNFSGPFKSQSAYTLNRYAPRSGKYMIFSIPHFELSFPEISLESRKFDIVYTTSRLRTDQIKIKLPDGYAVKYLPAAIRVQSPYVEYETIYDIQDGKIRISRKLAFPRRIIPVADYEAYKRDLQKIAYSSKDRIFLEQVMEEGEQQ